MPFRSRCKPTASGTPSGTLTSSRACARHRHNSSSHCASLLGPSTISASLTLRKSLVMAVPTATRTRPNARSPTDRTGPARPPCQPAYNPLPSTPQRRSSPTNRDHHSPPAAPHITLEVFVSEKNSNRTRPQPQTLPSSLPIHATTKKDRTSVRSLHIHPPTLARKAPPEPGVTRLPNGGRGFAGRGARRGKPGAGSAPYPAPPRQAGRQA